MSRKDVMFWIILLALFGFATMLAKAGEPYCDYAKEKAEADRLLNQSPQLIVGGGTNSTASANVIGIGVTESLSKYLKGRLDNALGQDDCNVYRLTNEIQIHVTYDLTSIQLDYLTSRQRLVDQGINELAKLATAEQDRVNAGSSTIATVATIEAASFKLTNDLATIKQQIALTHLPEPAQGSLNDLISQATTFNQQQQRDQAQQAKYDNWDVQLTTGVGTNPSQSMFSQLPSKGFTNLQFTYSFGGPARSRILDRSANHYTEWLASNDTGPLQLGLSLRSQVQRALEAAHGSQTAYERYGETIKASLASIEGVDSSAAHAFRVQLAIEQITNDIESQSNAISAGLYTLYLQKNFLTAN